MHSRVFPWVCTLEHTSFCFLSSSSEDPPGPALPEASQSFSVGAPYSLPSHIFPGACLPALCFLFPSPGKTQALKKGGH